MSTTTVSIAESAAAISEESHRISAIGPMLTRDQAEESILAIRLALAALSGQVRHLPSEAPKDSPEPFVGQRKGWWP